MEYLKIKTKGNASPQGKPRVYFACHPADVERSLERICGDIFETADCAVYYTADMAAPVPEENRETDLGRMNLFVIAVSYRLLSEPNRAMDEDFAFAKSHHIPVLPIMLEDGLDELYGRPDRFGELQYLNPDLTDDSAIPYEEKLKLYLSSVLIDAETADRVRAAFDAYIFLSYRKKDRVYANELMRLIHRNPVCRDIAIWYDEFLTPGESFNESIEKALKKSELFTLLVTPNLVNEDNYIITTEYPMARKTGKPVLPAEMVRTDHAELLDRFEGLPETISVEDEEIFQAQLLKTLENIARTENDDDPAHNYLIGLAYLDGIDVETDRERGLALITSAGEAGLPEAMHKLYQMYFSGVGVELDFHKALYWAQKQADQAEQVTGGDTAKTMYYKNVVATVYGELGEYEKKKDILEELYPQVLEQFGEESERTLAILNNLADAYGEIGDKKRRLDLLEQVLRLAEKTMSEDNPDLWMMQQNLAVACGELGDIGRAKELLERAYSRTLQIQGAEHPGTVRIMMNLARVCAETGDPERERTLLEEASSLGGKVLGDHHPFTLRILSDLAHSYDKLGEHERAKELLEQIYSLECEILGEDHRTTLGILTYLSSAWGNLGDRLRELELTEKAYAAFRRSREKSIRIRCRPCIICP